MSDPLFYRDYECNLSAPFIKGTKAVKTPSLQATDVSTTTFSLAGVKFYTGTFANATTFTFTSTQLPPMANQQCNGEISLYFNNDAYVHVSMAVLLRAKGANQQALIYQNVGNLTSVATTVNTNSVVFTISPAATCSWIFRGK